MSGSDLASVESRRVANLARGFTLMELVLTTAILSILAASAMPLYEVSIRRGREIELRRSLREIRRGLDTHYMCYIAAGGQTVPPGGQLPAQSKPPAPPGKPLDITPIDPSKYTPDKHHGFPPDLETLVEGVQMSGTSGDENMVKFMRRIPLDPMIDPSKISESDKNFGWGVRSYQDSSESTTWGGQNAYDVYSKSKRTALDGTKYNEW